MHSLQYTKAALGQLKNLERKNPNMAVRLARVINNLREEPRPSNSKKLQNYPNYRVKNGDYRIIYNFTDKKVIVEFIGHRKDVYRKYKRR